MTHRPQLRAIVIAALLALIGGASPAGAQNAPLPPVIETLTAPISDGEMAGIGCLVGTVAAGGAVVALAGGVGPVAAALQGPLTPLHVLEGGAALAFLVSSSCYVGQALAPLAALGWSTLSETVIPRPAAPTDTVTKGAGAEGAGLATPALSVRYRQAAPRPVAFRMGDAPSGSRRP